MVAQIILRFFLPDIPHGVTTIIVLILFFGGLNLFGLSILGEYIAKILEEAKSRPKFIRESVISRGRRLESTSEIDRLHNGPHQERDAYSKSY